MADQAVDAGALEATGIGGKVRYTLNERSFEKEGLYLLFPSKMQLLKLMGGVNGLVEDHLEGNVADGIPEAEVEERRERWGSNEDIPHVGNFFKFILSAMMDFSLVMLILVAVASLSLGVTMNEFASDTGGAGYVEGTSILTAVAIIVLFTALNDFQKDYRFAQLHYQLVNDQVIVKRADSAEPRQMSSSEVVVGDTLIVFRGEVVRADGVLVGPPCKVNELHVTGEADNLLKGEHDPFVMAGSHVVEGTLTMVVTCVGEYTFQAQKDRRRRKTLAPSAVAEAEENLTSLQLKLAKMARSIGKLGFSLSVVLFFVLTAKYLITKVVKGDEITNEAVERMTEYALVGLTLIVVTVPEGLPFSVTLAIAFSINRMVKENNMVRKLGSLEAMGRCSEVLVDLTGAITMNRMVLDQGYIGGTQFAISPDSEFNYSSLEASLVRSGGSDPLDSTLAKAMHAMYINSTARLISPNEDVLAEDDDDVVRGADGVLRKYFGNETEISLLKFGTALSSRFGTFRQMRRKFLAHRVAYFPFDPVNKWTAVLVRLDGPLDDKFYGVGESSASSSEGRVPLRSGERYRLYVKGAAEILLGFCTHILGASGSVEDIVDSQRKIRKMLSRWTHSGRRVLALAYKDIDYRPPRDVTDPDVSEMTCISIVGISDSIIPTVRHNVRRAQTAGVNVRLVTGENLDRAITIARKVNIFNPEYHQCMDSTRYNALTNDELKAYIPNLTILARATPDDKVRLIHQLQEDFGAVVATTGGNLSDQRALGAADIGFAMGVSGTGVSRSAGDIILLSDNFGSVVTAMKWGRNVFFSVRKFLQFQLTCNIVTVIITIVGSVTNTRGESPISPVALLWINLIMDTFAAIALASDPPSDSLLRKTKPVSLSDNVITRVMLMHILGQAAYQLLMLLLVLYIGPSFFDVERYERKHFTLVFNAHAMMTLFNFFNVRSVFQQHNVMSGLERNWYFWVVFLGSSGMQAAIVTVGSSWTKTQAIGPLQWVACLVMGAGTLLVGAFLRGIPTRGILLESKNYHDSPKERAEWRMTLARKSMQNKVMVAFRIAG